MLMPKKVKHRRVMKGRMRGEATRGEKLNFGDFGLKAMEAGWITDRQIEAARIAMTRHVKRGGKFWIRGFVREDQDFTRSRQQIDGCPAKHQALCRNNVGIARSKDFLHGSNRESAIGHGGDGLRTARSI